MKRLLFLMPVFALASCTVPQFQGNEDIQPETAFIEEIPPSQTDINDFPERINYKNQNAVWIPYIRYEEYMQGKSEDEFREIIRKEFASEYADGVNTLYVHAHPFADAYYKSEIFPKGSMLDGDYDPLEIMIQEAHALKISVHAWINPLRCQSVEEMNYLDDDFIIKQWAGNPDCRFVKVVNGRYYLDPSYNEVRDLICRCAEEIIENYNVDGIHIDDYFYPTTYEEFDAVEFQESGAEDLSEWRTQNCTEFVKALYDTVKSCGKDVVFGISPQGNINADYESQYADVRLWGSQRGYCDYIVPQIYFGFNNEICPFEQTLYEWESITAGSGVSLIVGLAEYKLNKGDEWAGEAGESEWIDNPDIVQQQEQLAINTGADGYARYK